MNLDELKQQAREALELADKATQGPWHSWLTISGRLAEVATHPRNPVTQWFCELSKKHNPRFESDAAFIAASRTLVPDLARAVLELADEVRHLEIANKESSYMLVEAADEIAQLKRETYCAFCGQRFALDGTAAQLVTEHILTCEKHPMREVERKLEIAQAEEMRLRDALDQTRNYIHDDCLQTALEWIDASLGKSFEEDKRDAN